MRKRLPELATGKDNLIPTPAAQITDHMCHKVGLDLPRKRFGSGRKRESKQTPGSKDEMHKTIAKKKGYRLLANAKTKSRKKGYHCTAED